VQNTPSLSDGTALRDEIRSATVRPFGSARDGSREWQLTQSARARSALIPLWLYSTYFRSPRCWWACKLGSLTAAAMSEFDAAGVLDHPPS